MNITGELASASATRARSGAGGGEVVGGRGDERVRGENEEKDKGEPEKQGKLRFHFRASRTKHGYAE
jgi:hypothetical protein